MRGAIRIILVILGAIGSAVVELLAINSSPALTLYAPFFALSYFFLLLILTSEPRTLLALPVSALALDIFSTIPPVYFGMSMLVSIFIAWSLMRFVFSARSLTSVAGAGFALAISFQICVWLLSRIVLESIASAIPLRTLALIIVSRSLATTLLVVLVYALVSGTVRSVNAGYVHLK